MAEMIDWGQQAMCEIAKILMSPTTVTHNVLAW